MKYLKVFETQAEESAWKESEEYIKTSLSMDKENMDELSYNSKVKFRAEYDLSGLEGDVILTNCGNIFDSLKVNGVEAVTGSVEVSREEVKYGVDGERIYWEKTLEGGMSFESSEEVYDYYQLPIEEWHGLSSDFEIEILGDYTEEEIRLFSCITYMQHNEMAGGSLEGTVEEIGDSSKLFFIKNIEKKILGINFSAWYMYNMYMICNFIKGVGFVLCDSNTIPVSCIIRGSYIKGEIVSSQVLETNSSNFTLDSNGYAQVNADILKIGLNMDGTLSYEGDVSNLGVIMSLGYSSNNIEECYIFTIDEFISEANLTLISGNTYSMGSLPTTYYSNTYVNTCFCDMDYVIQTDSGDTSTRHITSLDGIIPTTMNYSEEVYDFYTYSTKGIVFNSTQEMQNAQIKINGYIKTEGGGMGLNKLSDIENGSETYPFIGLAYADNIGTLADDGIFTKDELIKVEDGTYKFPQSWIDSAQTVFDSGDKVLFSFSNVLYYCTMPVYIKMFAAPVMNLVYLTSYSIIQETTSGGAPKELSIEASVGRVSLIGEVNDYFSTLPSNGFEECPLETVIIPDNVKSIGTKCFGHCDRLKKVYLPQNMDRLAGYSFGGNSVKRGNVVNVRSVKDESVLAFSDYGGTVNMFTATHDVDSIDSTTYILGSGFNLNQITELYIDGVKSDNITYEVQFEAVGKHTIKCIMNNETFASCKEMFYGCGTMAKLDLSNFDTSNVTDMSSMFSNCTLTSLNLTNFDTSNVTDMSGMFSGCYNLTSLDVSNFDTSNVTNMSSMFSNCTLTSLNLTNFDTSNVTDMSGMFDFCQSLTSLDVSNFDTSNVTDMSSMFGRCRGLTSLEVSNFNTSNVTSMTEMFTYCNGLTSLDLSNFNTSNVTTMWNMFNGCSDLTSVTFGDNFDTSNVANMEYMFNECSGLTSLDLSSFNTSNVTDMSYMFARCSGLTSLDLSNFDTSNVTDMYGMFSYCRGLTSVTFGSQADVSKVTSYSFMFEGITTTGTLYYNGNYDYSKIIAVLPSTWTAVDPNWVDLGLPSGLKWATCNVGATKPEEFGLYFAWGETQGYTGITDDKQFSWADYTLCDGTSSNMTKYNATDGLTTLEVSDDVAYATDSSCRMPTSAECVELTANTTSEWVDDYNGTGVAGRIFTSNVNGNSIFVPAAGDCLGGSVGNVGQGGYLWSSSLDSSRVQDAFSLFFKSGSVGVDDGGRYLGLPVRAVRV